MGHSYEAVCKDCGHHFVVWDGGGFGFDLLRCDQCGETKGLSHKELGGLQRIGDFDEGESYLEALAALTGLCHCDGHFRYHAPIRCPECRSTAMENGVGLLMYD